MNRLSDLCGRRVFIRRDHEIHTVESDGNNYKVDTSGFDGVVQAVDGQWLYILVADEDPVGFEGIWINSTLQREIAVLK